jgi:hypothetical protein
MAAYPCVAFTEWMKSPWTLEISGVTTSIFFAIVRTSENFKITLGRKLLR